MHLKLKLTLACVTLIFSGCQTKMSIQSSAVDPEWTGDEPQRVMVVCLNQRRYRTPFESTFVDELASRGYNAVTSVQYAPAVSSLHDQQTFEDVIKKARADSVLTVKAIGIRDVDNTDWAIAYTAASLLADNYQESRGMRAIVAGGALADNLDAANYALEVQFFDAQSDRMIWTAKTKAFDAGNLDDFVAEFANVLIEDLVAKKVITPEPTL